MCGTIHDFAALSRFITNGEWASLWTWIQMNSQSRVFDSALEATLDGAAMPLRCPRPMITQSLVPWTSARLLGALLRVLFAAPALLLQPAMNRRRA
jgi:hypothetical protein